MSGDICAHGGLRRQCEVCERDDEIERLRAEVATLRETLVVVQRKFLDLMARTEGKS